MHPRGPAGIIDGDGGITRPVGARPASTVSPATRTPAHPHRPPTPEPVKAGFSSVEPRPWSPGSGSATKQNTAGARNHPRPHFAFVLSRRIARSAVGLDTRLIAGAAALEA